MRLLPRRLALAVASAAVLLSFGQAFTLGLFGDGLQYGLIARNLAEGHGSFWNLQDVGPFRDQPPLGLWLQSLWFLLVGDGLHTERLWSLLSTHALILATPFVLRRADIRAPLWPFLLLIWVNPHTVWVALNNVLEPTMALFALGAVGAALRGVSSRRALPSLLAGLLVLGAVLCKGPAGLFPLAVPACAAACGTTDRRTAARSSAWMLLGFGLPFAAILLGPGGAFFAEYLDEQLLAALRGERDRADQRFFLVKAFAQDFGVTAAVALGLWIAAGRPALALRRARLPLLIGLCAALPLLISPKQARWYLLPATPYLTAALALALRDAWRALETRASMTVATRLAALFLIATPVAAFATRGHIDERRVLQRDLIELEINGPLHACQPEQLCSRGLLFGLARIHRAELLPPAEAPGLHLGQPPCQPACERTELRSLSLWSCP